MIGTDGHWKPFYPSKRPLMADFLLDGDMASIEKNYGHMALRKSKEIEGAYEAERFFPDFGENGSHLYMNAAPIKDEKGEIKAVVVTYQDLSERIKIVGESKRHSSFARKLIENSIDGVIATDVEGKIVIFNQGAQKILGYNPEEVVGKLKYKEILSEETTKDIIKTYYSEDNGPYGKIINKETQILNNRGESVPLRLSGTLLYEKEREIGSVVFIQDLREILQLQREREQAHRIAAIGKVVAGMAHYIKNILSGLKGGAFIINTAIRKKDFNMLGTGWDMVSRNLLHLSDIVQNMLSYSTIKKPKYRSVNPNALVRDVVELMGDTARVSKVLLEHDLKEGIPNVEMDPTAIHRCLLNLVRNAIDACAERKGEGQRGRVTVRSDQSGGWGVRFTVEDTGMGMDEETQKKVFDDFFSTKGYQGTGLGLPVTRNLIEDHGGEITFDSTPGKGTRFYVLLP
jgi:PAS domain S-box-containing protein